LDALARGRFHLGIGSGAAPGITAIGGPQWEPGESVERVREAIEIARVIWSGQTTGSYHGQYYQLTELSLPPAPSAGLDIWIGAVKPRMRRLIAQAADGWLPGMFSVDPDEIRGEVDHLNQELDALGRPQGSVRRIYNTIAKKLQPASEGFLVGPADQWVDQLTYIALEFGFDAFLLGDRDTTVEHLDRFAEEVIPQVRANVARGDRNGSVKLTADLGC
jgi:alkanesulfonate monooxygenase SsuD/methylene tetrahydromethanopterin reductase-like flavin-dependent oxidoreductase (luciferase family)